MGCINESINVGDILQAKGNFCNSGYQFCAPVIYLGECGGKLYGLKLSSREKRKKFNKCLQTITLTRDYGLKETSTIDFRNIVEFQKIGIKKKISSLNVDKLNEIVKMMVFILNNNNGKLYYQGSDFPSLKSIIDTSSYIPYYSRGDLIKYYNGYLLITNNDGINITGYKVYLKSSEKYKFNTGDGKVNYILYDEPVQISIYNIKYFTLISIMSNWFMCYVEAKKYVFCNKNCKGGIVSRVNYDWFLNPDTLLREDEYRSADCNGITLSEKVKVKIILNEGNEKK